MNQRVAKRLYDAELASHELAHFTENKTLDEYLADRGLQLVVERLLEIIGEAIQRAAREDTGITMAIPDAQKIIGMRNRIIHGYDEINPTFVWDAATRHVPVLQAQLEALLAEERLPNTEGKRPG